MYRNQCSNKVGERRRTVQDNSTDTSKNPKERAKVYEHDNIDELIEYSAAREVRTDEPEAGL